MKLTVQISGLERLESLLGDVVGSQARIGIDRSKRTLRRLRLELERIEGSSRDDARTDMPRRRK